MGLTTYARLLVHLGRLEVDLHGCVGAEVNEELLARVRVLEIFQKGSKCARVLCVTFILLVAT